MQIRNAILTMPKYKPGIKAKRSLVGPDGRPIVRLNANEGPWPPFDDAIAAMRAALPDLNRYPDQSFADLRARLGELYGVDPLRFVVGSGSGSLIRLLTLALIDPGDEALIPWPPYPAHGTAVGVMGGVVVRVPLVDGAIDMGAVLDAVTPRTRLALICSPHNPTGAIVRRADFEAYLERVPGHVVTLLDQAYQEYVDDPSAVDGFDYIDHEKPVIVFRTFSKVYGLAGLRSGYGAAPQELIDGMGKAAETFATSHMAVVGSVASLARQDLVRERAARTAAERARMTAAMAERGYEVTPTQANFMWLDVRTNAKALADAMLALGVQIRSGEVHDAPNHVRVTFGTAEENDAFLAAFDAAIAQVAEPAAAAAAGAAGSRSPTISYPM